MLASLNFIWFDCSLRRSGYDSLGLVFGALSWHVGPVRRTNININSMRSVFAPLLHLDE